MKRWFLEGWFAALFVGTLAGGQTGPGVPNLVYNQSELFTEITRLARLPETATYAGHSLMHDGYMVVVRTNPGGFDFYDLSNPFAPQLVQQIAEPQLSEPHTHAQTTAYGGSHAFFLWGSNGSLGGTGFSLWDWTNVLAPQNVVNYAIPGVPGGYATGTFWMFYQAPYMYCGIGSQGLYIVDVSDPLNPFVAKQMPTSTTGGFNAVNTLVVGNLLLVTNADGGPGMARFDISDPIDPQLIHATTNTAIPYGIQINGGMLLVPGVEGPASRGPLGGTNAFEIRDPFQAGFPLISTTPLLARGGSVVIQDQFAHVAGSLDYRKFDISDPTQPELVGRANGVLPGGDWDWVTPIGNLAVLGDDQGKGTTLVPHDALPDTLGPVVTMVQPEDGAVNQALTSRVGVTLSDMIEVASLDTTTFTVRPVGGAALPGVFSNQFGIVNFTPDQPLQPDTTYEVLLDAGGVQDWCGNGLQTDFTSRFSTGSNILAVDVAVQLSGPIEVGGTVDFDVSSVQGPGPFQYSWDFGDGTPPTALSSNPQASHTYASAGHYAVIVTATNGSLTATDSFVQTVHYPLTADRPTRSSTVVLDEARGRAWCVNADNDSVTAITLGTITKDFEVPVGAHPRTLAQAPDGTLWVVCEADDTIHVLDPANGAKVATIGLPYGSAPYGIAMTPDGASAFVTLRARGEVIQLDPALRSVLGTVAVGPEPKGLAITADSMQVFVTRFLSSADPRGVSGPFVHVGNFQDATSAEATFTPIGGPSGRAEPVAEIYELSTTPLAKVRSIPLRLEDAIDGEANGRGLPNYLNAIAVSPDGRRLWVPSKKDNIERGSFRDGQALDFDNTVRTILSQVDLGELQEAEGVRVDFNDRDMAFAVALSPLGDYAFTALQGSNAVDVRDAYSGAIVGSIDGTGLAPQGLAISNDASTLFVHNFLSRSVSVYDIAGVTSSTDFTIRPLGNVETVANEDLAPAVLQGKQIFYNAADPRMNEDGYLSCATCHLDGAHDGMTWDFTDRGEGLRNTTTLLGRSGLGHGNVHWTGNFDEIQDFENDIRLHFGGDGFLEDALFVGPVQAPLGQPKAGLSAELDALAAYVSSLSTVGRSPYRDSDGTLSTAGENGKVLFQSLGCSTCHSGSAFTDSASGLLHDVGTLRPSSGQASGGLLTGIDTPTLRGLWDSAPYLHDGSARTVLDVLTTRNPADMHGATSSLTPTELDELVAYLLQIDDAEPAASPLPMRSGKGAASAQRVGSSF